jgi:uncharacterized protein (DUF302 family)
MKLVVGFIGGIVFTGIMVFLMMGSLMFNEIESPYGVEETAARIQRNIQGDDLKGKGWSLSGLRDPAKAVANSGTNVLPVLLVEACSTKYSGPILKADGTRILSILMPCSITVYKKDNGKTYIGMMNAGLMGKMFGSTVAEVMGEVAKDQKIMVTFDPDKPAPPLIKLKPGGGGGAGGKDTSGC